MFFGNVTCRGMLFLVGRWIERDLITLEDECRRGDVAVVQTQYTVIVLTLRFRGDKEK